MQTFGVISHIGNIIR